MKLLIDVGNSRLKWQLRRQGSVVARGLGELAGADPLTDFPPAGAGQSYCHIRRDGR